MKEMTKNPRVMSLKKFALVISLEISKLFSFPLGMANPNDRLFGTGYNHQPHDIRVQHASFVEFVEYPCFLI
jgi:hypothetical protein